MNFQVKNTLKNNHYLKYQTLPTTLYMLNIKNKLKNLFPLNKKNKKKISKETWKF
jgi:hypothetical protein